MGDKRVRIIEVGPRDGFQNICEYIPEEIKIEEIEKLIASGITDIEITSFVHPKAIPQLRDSADVAQKIVSEHKDINLIALIPNLRGAENAFRSGIKTVSYVISASERHNKENVNRSIDESLAELRKVKESIPELDIRLDIATAFGCPFQGKVSNEEVFYVADRGLEIGVNEIVLCDTIGVADPEQVKKLVTVFKERYPDVKTALHLHDTRGRGLVNAYAGLYAGIDSFETSVGGLGGCPFAPGAAGNTATEDLLGMFESMGYETGVDFGMYMDAVQFANDHINADFTSRMLKACNREV